MNSHRIYLPIIFLMSLIIALVLVRNHAIPEAKPVTGQTDTAQNSPTERLRRLEPDTPQDMGDPPFFQLPLPSKTKPIPEILSTGKELPVEFAYNDPYWQRPAYKSYWQSSVSGGRWSYVPSRIHYAFHRLFTTYPTASIFYDFVHELGIAEESGSFNLSADKPFEKMVIAVMQSDVKQIFTLGNQVVIKSEPSRSGLQVLTIPLSQIEPFNPDEAVLVQLSTPEGYEMDYSTISYVKQW